MFKNNLTIAWRNLIKRKSFTLINVGGLALGMASCLIIMLFVIDELSYDTFNEKADQIHRVVFKAKIAGEDVREAVVMPPVAATLKEEIPEVTDATRMRRLGEPKVSVDNTVFKNGRYAYADPNIFEVFTLPVLAGNTADPLREPNTVVLNQSEALRYFGSIEAGIGRNIQLEGHDRPYRVTAVMEDIPHNAHFHFEGLVSMKGHELANKGTWMNSDFFTYVVLKKGTDYRNVEAKLPGLVEKYMGPQMKDEIGLTYAEFNKENTLGLYLQPLTDIHLDTEFSKASTIEEGGDIRYVYTFSAVAFFMLLIACINFVNLSTAAASKRAKEVGVKKVLGSNRAGLINQFLWESLLSSVMAMLVSVLLIAISLPLFNSLSGKALNVSYLLRPGALAVLLFGTLIVAFLAGGYPAFFLSSFKPMAALKNRFSGTGHGSGLRSGLVVFQFVISAGLVLAVLVVNQQMRYIQEKDIGYDRNELLVLRESYLMGNDNNVLKNELLQDPDVLGISQSSFVPAGPTDNAVFGVYMDGAFKRRSSLYAIDDQYLSVMGMTLVAGRDFSDNHEAEQGNTIINETAVKTLGLGDDPIGKTIERAGEPVNQKLKVIGVVKDFNFQSLHKSIEPLIMTHSTTGGLIVKVKRGDMARVIQKAKSLWEELDPELVFEYSLLNESYRQTYVTEDKMGTLLHIFALLTILVACLGLYGLVTFATEQRFKEIGVRKVLGSSVSQIIVLLSKDFLKWVGLSFLLAFPLSYYFMDQWLEGFAYHIDLHWWLFALAALITLMIAFMTILYKSYSAATMNPVKSLRME